ncbi:hypothetical protein [Antrihabitans sp. YC2-6]|uniref:hypothetical protein n=1 Tax=Antrihabitans sp. YC2-6 TaxID=2799498 RepID=UPI0018F64C00|nr:hypothetical protein [Antrihabitans sp. YC2-6]MBJ8343959.1 hypothetical protein [Antrihabitans sp. YC2-6]
MSTKETLPAIDEILFVYRSKVAELIQDEYGHGRAITTGTLTRIDCEAKAAIQRLMVQERLDEVVSAITASDDERDDQDFASQMSYVVGHLARRAKELEAKLVLNGEERKGVKR